MNRKTLLLTTSFVLITTAIVAQQNKNYCFTYEFTFQKDTTDTESKVKELFELLVSDAYSVFISANKIKNDRYLDSLIKSIDRAGGIKNVTSLNIVKPGGSASEFVIYKFPDGNIEYQQKVGGTLYSYKEMMDVDWKVYDSSLVYAGYDCQMAVLSFGGRQWTAWFTMDIPVQNGPYKFMGLPGLIVKVEDTKNECLFELIHAEQRTEWPGQIPKAEMLDKTQLAKMVENLNNRPFSAVINAQLQGSSTNIRLRDKDGNEISVEEMDKKRRDITRKNNNHIEWN